MFEDGIAYDPSAVPHPGVVFQSSIDPSSVSPEDLQRWDGVMQSIEIYAVGNYGPDLASAPQSVDTLLFDLKSDLASGNQNAWNMIWKEAEVIYGITDIHADALWYGIVLDNIFDSVYGADWRSTNPYEFGTGVVDQDNAWLDNLYGSGGGGGGGGGGFESSGGSYSGGGSFGGGGSVGGGLNVYGILSDDNIY